MHTLLKHILLTIMLYWFPLTFARGQAPYFIKFIGSASANDQARAIQQLNDGTIYMGGLSDASGNTDLAILKLNNEGDSIWMKTYGDATLEYGLFLNRCGLTDLIMVGEKYNDSTGTDVLVLKADSAGTLLWQSLIQTDKNESGKYIEQTMDGGFILCGYQTDGFGFNDIFVAKLDSTGEVSWSSHYGGTDNEYANQIRELPDGTYIVTSDTKSKGAGGYDVELLKLSADGEIIWDYTFGDEFQNGCQGVLVAANGDLISFGETEVYQFSPFEFFIERISNDGISKWRKTFGGSGSDAVFALIEDDAGNFILTGYSNSYNGGAPLDIVIAKTDAEGNLLWVESYGTTGIDIGYGIFPANDGFMVGGTAFNKGSNDFCLLHVSQSGLLTSAGLAQDFQVDERISVFPNPSVGSFTIDLKTFEKNIQVQLYNAIGQLVYEKRDNGIVSELSIDFSGESGIYWLIVQTDTKNWVRTIEIQR